ncbi:extracellular solute-binding protein [Chenggangzhangella methanolivorans]|uniref:Extracellular solute-binding protein n=1 Tax=Chenggangzhangella methanolivorans TaxID=1437009 RepID=A0A9E6R646_9HYPH|nr:extracellular solute-binding protein [Chenggangzhangella methanolivorans]QZN98588.1 extracellular solute-binding protein [Chenggangzhangella methanolivorans]
MKPLHRRDVLRAGVALAAPALLPARAFAAETLVLYNGQHAEPATAVVHAFMAATGVTVAIRKGGSAQLANQIVEEGARSPADVFFSEETAPVTTLAARKLLAPVDKATLDQIPARYAANDGRWIGVTARCRVVAYDKQAVKAEELPASVLDFATPAFKDRVAYVPTSGEFQSQSLAILRLKGRDAALGWLKGLKENGRVYNGNVAAVQAVQRGEIATALVNSYYWYAVADEIGPENMRCELHYLGKKDPGALVTLSAAGALASSKKPELAQRFLAFMTGDAGQKAIVEAVAEYPVRPGVASPYDLKPLDQLDPPDLTPDDVSDAVEALSLQREAGLA